MSAVKQCMEIRTCMKAVKKCVRKKKGEIVTVYAMMKKGNEVKYASVMEGVYELMDQGYEFVEF